MKQMEGQISLFALETARTRDELQFEKGIKRLREWITLPDTLLIPDGSDDRERIRTLLGVEYCTYWKAAHHVCDQMPDDKYIWLNHVAYDQGQYWVLNSNRRVAGEHVRECPYCGADLANGRGDVMLIKADSRSHLCFLNWCKKKGRSLPADIREAFHG